MKVLTAIQDMSAVVPGADPRAFLARLTAIARLVEILQFGE